MGRPKFSQISLTVLGLTFRMVAITLARIPDSDGIKEYTLIELQGSISVQDGLNLANLEIGHLFFTKQVCLFSYNPD